LLAAGDRRPLFLLVGEQDEFCPLPAFLDLVARIRDARVPVTAVLVPGANHFFDRLGHVARQEFERFAFRIGGGSEPARRYEVRDV
jgi:acetyl esterase/lipase